MSVEDETWDRPTCKSCKQVIKYGDKRAHLNGACLKELSFFKRAKSLNKQFAEDLQQYFSYLRMILMNIQAVNHNINFTDLTNSLKYHAK